MRDLFKKFAENIDSELKDVDCDTHYNVGIAFKALRLFEEAISEFKKAAIDKELSDECYRKIDECYKELEDEN
ncbi:hypothetical protein ACFL27_03470 [candidate division CSSED10-310 bacterium]|uniref:Tetratricopeptide repeat protein n=1 Tax=candidate division CSSED10-310 bacterium TaxID=2855610 RepID=A0ABV6YSS7_UNCC1